MQPNWPVDGSVQAWVTTRDGGVSLPPYDQLNLATHVGDVPEAVLQNRAILRSALSLPSEPVWLKQVHGTTVIAVDELTVDSSVEADGSYTEQSGRVLAILTADCLPILLAKSDGSGVMALHAGWRGLADGIIAQGLHTAGWSPVAVCAWVGPGIGQMAFEVGGEVRDVFLQQQRALPTHFSASTRTSHWYADLAGIALWQLQQLGVAWLGGGHWCTARDQTRFYSYRRQGVTGRMASLIWINQAENDGYPID